MIVNKTELYIIFGLLIIFLIFFSLIYKTCTYEKFTESRHYSFLKQNWSKIFPDSNRNSASSLFFKFIIDIDNLTYNDFIEYNKLYCPVSGSLVSPGRESKQITLRDINNTNNLVSGFFFFCCWPCLCDISQYAYCKQTQITFQDQTKSLYVIVIRNPCNKEDFPRRVNRRYLCNGENINSNKNYILPDSENLLVIGLLHPPYNTNSEEITHERCSNRNPNIGMGQIFINLAD